MSYRSGFGGGPGKKSASISAGNSKSYSMNAVPPPSSLANSRPGKFQKAGNLSSLSMTPSSGSASGDSTSTATGTGLSKHGYSTMNAIAQFASSSQYALGKRKSKTEDE